MEARSQESNWATCPFHSSGTKICNCPLKPYTEAARLVQDLNIFGLLGAAIRKALSRPEGQRHLTPEEFKSFTSETDNPQHRHLSAQEFLRYLIENNIQASACPHYDPDKHKPASQG